MLFENSAVPGADFIYNPSNQYYMLASTVLFLYDFLLTFPQEFKLIWSSKFSKVNVLITTLRYITLLGCLPALYLTTGVPVQSCDTTYKLVLVPGLIGVVSQSIIAGLLIIRTHAIYEAQRWILYVTIPIGLLSVGLSSLVLTHTYALGEFNPFEAPDDVVYPGSS